MRNAGHSEASCFLDGKKPGCQCATLENYLMVFTVRCDAILLKCEDNLKEIEAGAKPSKDLFPKLSKHWEEPTPGTIDNDDEPDPGTFQVF